MKWTPEDQLFTGDIVLSGSNVASGSLTALAAFESPGTGVDSFKAGPGATASGLRTVAVGNSATATGEDGVAVGDNAYVDQGFPRGTAVGESAYVEGSGSVALGYFAEVTSDFGVAIGDSVAVDNGSSGSVAIGSSVSIASNSPGAIAIGNKANVATDYSLAIGNSAKIVGTSNETIAIGHKVTAQDFSVLIGANLSGAGQSRVVGIGRDLTLYSNDMVVIGDSAVGSGGGSVVIGSDAKDEQQHNVVVGYQALANEVDNVVVGYRATASFPCGGAIGYAAQALSASEITFGNQSGDELSVAVTKHLRAFGKTTVSDLLQFTGSVKLSASSSSSLVLMDDTGTDFGLLQLGGTGSDFPSLKRVGAVVQVRLADDSDYTNLSAKTISATSDLAMSPDAYLRWIAKSEMRSAVDGDITLSNNAQTDFGLLQLGGTTSDYPALKRNAATIHVRRADDSAYTSVTAESFAANSDFRAGATGLLYWNVRSRMHSDADGNIRLTNAAETDFGLLQLGGTGSAFLAIKNDSGFLAARLADDSAYAPFKANTVVLDSYMQIGVGSTYKWATNRSRMSSPADGNIRLTNAAETDFSLLQLGGTTTGFPAIARVGPDISFRLADDSAYTDIAMDRIFAAGAVRTGAGGYFHWQNRSEIHSPADGNILFLSSSADDFGMLQLGGTDNTYPALKRSGADLQARLADDSTYADFIGALVYGVNGLTAGGTAGMRWNARSAMFSTVDGNISLYNAALTDFGLLQFGGNTSAFPALQRNTSHLRARLADDSADCNMYCAYLVASAGGQFAADVRVGASSKFHWNLRSQMTSPADGNIALFSSSGDDFGMLQLGGTTADYPAIKRSTNQIQFRTADDLGNASISCANVFGSSAVFAGASSYFAWTGRSEMLSPSDGNITLTNDAQTDFSLLQFGGSTSGFPALKRSSAVLHVRLADDSDYANLISNNFQSTGYVIVGSTDFLSFGTGGGGRSKMWSDVDGDFRLTNAAADDFGLLQFGTTGSDAPALQRSGASLRVRLADDSGYASFLVGALTSVGSVEAGSSGQHFWTSKSRMYSDVDSNIRLANNAGTDFSLLQFGGTSNSFPALKRSGNALQVRLADDSADANLFANNLFANTRVELDNTGYFNWNVRTRLYGSPDGFLKVTNNAVETMLELGGDATGSLNAPNSHLILSSSAGSTVAVSGNLFVADSRSSTDWQALHLKNLNTGVGANVKITMAPAATMTSEVIAEAPGASNSNLAFDIRSAGVVTRMLHLQGGNHAVLSASQVTVSGTMAITDLPISNPHQTGSLWIDAGALKVSGYA